MRTSVPAAVFLVAASGLGCSGPTPAPTARPEIRVPFVTSRPAVVDAMLKLADVKAGETVYDLGCGDGRIAIAAVGRFKAKRGLGIDFYAERLTDCDAAVTRAIEDKELTAEQANALTFKQGDVLKMTPDEFRDVDVVTLYLSDAVNKRLKPTLQAGLRPGARIVSHDYQMGDDLDPDLWQPDKIVVVKTDREKDHTLRLWVVKATAGVRPGGPAPAKR
jgi:SAM-dependent methyltransferase